jgi:hypothetical protein
MKDKHYAGLEVLIAMVMKSFETKISEKHVTSIL